MKTSLFFITLILSVKIFALTKAHPSLPQEISFLLTFIGTKDQSLQVQKINHEIQKFSYDNKNLDPYLTEYIHSTFHKWLLIYSKELISDYPVNYELLRENRLETNQKDLLSFLRKLIYQDIDQIIINKPNLKKKGSIDKLSQQELKICSMILPWLSIINKSQNNQEIHEELQDHVRKFWIYLEEKLSLYSLLLNKEKKMNTVAFLFRDEEIKDTKPAALKLPKPVNDWVTPFKQTPLTKKKNEQGLPVPIDDWVLDF